jgi:hypothetical protein
MAAWVPVAVLERWEIRHTRVVQTPGQLVVTAPWVYHQGWNGGWNVAEAINYGDARSAARARHYRACVPPKCPVAVPLVMKWPDEYLRAALPPSVAVPEWPVPERDDRSGAAVPEANGDDGRMVAVKRLLKAEPLTEAEVTHVSLSPHITVTLHLLRR